LQRVDLRAVGRGHHEPVDLPPADREQRLLGLLEAAAHPFELEFGRSPGLPTRLLFLRFHGRGRAGATPSTASRRSWSEKLPMILRRGSGSLLTRVGSALIWSSSARSGSW